MEHFDSFSNYVRFAWAREFTTKDPCEATFKYTKNTYERLGDAMTGPVLRPMDFSARNSRNPFFITAMTIAALFVATLVFYPAVVAGLLTAGVVTGIKVTLFSLTQLTIVGLCLRTLGRLNNEALMDEWDQNHLNPLGIGSVRL